MIQQLSILFVIGSCEIGGAEMQLLKLVKNLHGKFARCSLFILQNEGALIGQYREMGIPLFFGGLSKGDLSTAPWKIIHAEIRLIKTILRTRPDIIHCFLPLITFMGSMAGRLVGHRKVVISRRALGTHQDRYPILIPFDRIANYLSRAVTVNSKAVWKDVVNRDRIKPEKLILIYNGLDASIYEVDDTHAIAAKASLKIPEKRKIVIVLANLIPYKGHSDFLKAARIVVQKRTDICFLLVGEDRGIRKNLEAEVENLSLAGYVRFVGQRKDVPALLAVSDLSVLPSHEEGFSNVILESMAAGLPVIATKVGGNSEAVADGITGWLVPPKEPELMAEKILDVLRDPEKANQMGKEGQDRVRKLFSVDTMVRKHLNLYRSILSMQSRKVTNQAF